MSKPENEGSIPSPAPSEIQSLVFVKGKNSWEEWRPGKTLTLHTRGFRGVKWTEFKCSRDANHWYSVQSRMTYAVVEDGVAWLVLTFAPLGADKELHAASLGPITGTVQPLQERPNKHTIWWGVGESIRCSPSAVNISRQTQLRAREVLGEFLIREGRFDSVLRSGVGPYLVWWIHL